MDVLPRHVICVLGRWDDFSDVRSVVAQDGFTFDEEYSQLVPDDRMPIAFEASIDRFDPTITDDDWHSIQTHTAVAYVLSPPIPKDAAESIAARSLLLVAQLLIRHGGLATKSESAGLAHGRSRWIELAKRFSTSMEAGDRHSAAASLYWAWVQRLIHDDSMGVFYSVGMHLLGHRDTEIDDSLDPSAALEWIDLMGLYLVADKPNRPILEGEGFRLRSDGPRRIIRHEACERYEVDEFFFNPYGYHRLVVDER